MINKGIYSLLFVILLSINLPVNAQPPKDTTWKQEGNLRINLNQVSLNSWAAGGDNAIGFSWQFNYFANYKKERHILHNHLELDFGLNRTKSDGTKKTNDKIYLSSVYGYELRQNLYLSGLLTFQTQFAKGYDYDTDPRNYISRFMSPGYLLAGAGFTWTPKPWFTATLTPATWRCTFVTSRILSDEGQFGVTPGKHSYTEFGTNLRMTAQYGFLKNMTVFSRLALYSNYLKAPLNIYFTWDVQLNMTINKWFASTLSTNMIYDNYAKITQKDGSKGPRLQFKEALNIGFNFIF